MRLRRATAAVLMATIAAVGAGCTGADSAAPATPMTPIGSASGSGSTPGSGSGSASASASGPAPASASGAAGSGSASMAEPGPEAADEVPAATVELIRATITAVNDTAGTSPEQQRVVFERVVDPEHRQQQQSCGAATTTVRFEPAWNDLRPTPGDEPDSYQLPALIRVYTGDRITRTDVTALTVTISAGQAHLPPICVA